MCPLLDAPVSPTSGRKIEFVYCGFESSFMTNRIFVPTKFVATVYSGCFRSPENGHLRYFLHKWGKVVEQRLHFPNLLGKNDESKIALVDFLPHSILAIIQSSLYNVYVVKRIG